MKKQTISTGSTGLLLALAGSILLASLGTSIVTVALPALSRVFSAGVQQVQWVVLAYLLAVTVTIVLAGRLGDLYGQRRVLLTGLALFTLASALCAGAPGLGWLVAARALQGLAAAILMSLPLSMAKGLVPKARLGTVMGLMGTMSAIGTALGPSLGGVVIGALGWRAAFVLLGLAGLGLWVLALRGIPKVKAAGDSAQGMDWAGSVWLSITLLCFSLLATGGKVGLAIQPWMWLIPGVVSLWLFIRTERQAARPLVPVALLGERALVSSLSMNLLVGAIMMSTLVVGPFFLFFGLGLKEAETGMVMAMGPLAAALSGVPAGRITDRFGVHRTLMLGLLQSGMGLCCFAIFPHFMGVAGYVIALVLITPGFQLFMAANNTAVMARAAEEHKGLLSGLLGLSRNLGFMAGASLLPLVFASLLGDQVVADSSAQAISRAFSITFLIAAGLCVLAIVLAWWGRSSQRASASC